MVAEAIKKQQNRKIVKLRAQGVSQAKIGKEVGLSQKGVAKREAKLKDLIEAETHKLFKMLPDITKQLGIDIKTSGKLSEYIAGTVDVENNTIFKDPKDILKFQDLAYKKQKDIMQAAGMVSGSSQSIFVQNIYNDNRTQVFSPKVFKALGNLFHGEDEEDWEEAEFDEIEDEEEK